MNERRKSKILFAFSVLNSILSLILLSQNFNLVMNAALAFHVYLFFVVCVSFWVDRCVLIFRRSCVRSTDPENTKIKIQKANSQANEKKTKKTRTKWKSKPVWRNDIKCLRFSLLSRCHSESPIQAALAVAVFSVSITVSLVWFIGSRFPICFRYDRMGPWWTSYVMATVTALST